MADVLASRLESLLPGGKGVWVPMDHSSSAFPERGMADPDSSVDSVIEGGADAIILHKGAVSYHFKRTGWSRFVCHASVSTVHGGNRSQDKILVANATESISRGAIGISAQVNLGDRAEPDMIRRIASITSESIVAGIPVLGMFYPRGENLHLGESDITGGVAHAARLAWEMGCNVVKVPWTGSEESFRIVTSSVPIPVLVSGGARDRNFADILKIVELSLTAGGAGVCIGRHVFGSEKPASSIKALRAMVHDGVTSDEAMKYLG